MQEEILIRIALIDIAREAADALTAEESAPDPRALSGVERALRKRALLRFATGTLPRIARIAAAAALTASTVVSPR